MPKPLAEDAGKPALRVTADAAIRELDEQITNGTAVRATLSDARTVDEAKTTLRNWTDAASDVIEQVFTGRAYWAEFQHVRTAFHDGVLRPRGLGQRDRESPEAVAAMFDERLRVLRDLVERARRLGRFAAGTTSGPQIAPQCASVPDTGTVFVVHGRDLVAREALFDFLRSLSLRPLEWEQAVALTGKGSPFIWEVVQAGIASAGAVVVLLTGDDEARLRGHLLAEPRETERLAPQPRPNVLLEMGMALMSGRERTVVVRVGELRGVSDIDGIHVLTFDNNDEHRRSIIDRLRTAGCSPDDAGTSWKRSGRVPDPKEFSNSAPTSTGADPPVRCEAVACLRLGERGFRDKLSVAVKLVGASKLPEFRIDGVKLGVSWFAGPVGSGSKHFDVTHFVEQHDGESAIRKDWVLTAPDVEALTSLSPCASVALEGVIRTSHGALPCNLGPVALARGHVWNSFDADRP